MLAREGDAVLRRRQLFLKLGDVAGRLELGICLDDREESPERCRQMRLRLRRRGDARATALDRDRLVARGDDGLERIALELHRPFDGVDEIRDEIMTPLQLDVDLLPAVHDLIPEAYQAVVDADDPEEDSGDDDQEDDESHGDS